MAARKAKAEAPAEASAPKLVRMVRDKSAFPAPHSADVHPDMVESYRAGGFEVA